MDTTDTTPDVITDADETETPGFGREVAKTLGASAATTALMLGALYASSVLTPKVKAFVARRRATNEVVEATTVETPAETPEA